MQGVGSKRWGPTGTGTTDVGVVWAGGEVGCGSGAGDYDSHCGLWSAIPRGGWVGP